LLKRLFDILVAGSILLLTLPLILATALAVRLSLGAPVLLQQARPGKDGIPFLFYKFRTMTEERDAAGFLLPDERRLTPFGRWLRSSSLDELPQLINVLKGDMSLVGPRPLLMEYLPLYSPQQARRHDVRPGITGWAQVNGRNALSWEERFRLDVWYVDHRSLLLDLRILLLTVLRILQAKDITQPGQATMSRFAGSGDE
jgi:lipopolysaccharide/colanic/teichoic acid biosynthesis glycosyltransferase